MEFFKKKKNLKRNSPDQLLSRSSPAKLQAYLKHASVYSWKLIHDRMTEHGQITGLLHQTAVMTWVVHTGEAPGPVIIASLEPAQLASSYSYTPTSHNCSQSPGLDWSCTTLWHSGTSIHPSTASAKTGVIRTTRH